MRLKIPKPVSSRFGEGTIDDTEGASLLTPASPNIHLQKKCKWVLFSPIINTYYVFFLLAFFAAVCLIRPSLTESAEMHLLCLPSSMGRA